MKTRVISAVVMLLVGIPFLIFAPGIVFTIGIGLVGLIAVKEIIKAIKGIPMRMQLLMYVAMIATIIFSYFIGQLDYAFLVILFLIAAVLTITKQDLKIMNFTKFATSYTILAYLTLTFNAFIVLRLEYDIYYVLYPMLIAVVCDTFGYFGGMTFGKRKLIPEISPKKTIEGAISASVFGIIGSALFLMLLLDFSILPTIIFSVVMVVLSQFGDLFASLLKRTYDVKDFSNMIPGHGGILDRFDSILFNMLVFNVLLTVFHFLK